MNFVVTGFSQNYWNPWGGCWLASLKLLANTSAQPVVVNYGLSKKVLSTLKKYDVTILDGNYEGHHRIDTIKHIAKIAKSKDDQFAYFDADVWFQSNFDSLYDQIDNGLVVAQNGNLGMVAGSKTGWQKFDFVSKITAFVGDPKVFESFGNFRGYADYVDNSYNWTAVSDLTEENGLLSYKGHTPCAIHPTGKLKHFCLNKKMLFSHRYYQECETFYDVKKNSCKMLLKCRLGQLS